MTRRSWKSVQATSLRHAFELCKDYARDKRNLSVERIADEMGLADHFVLYKWFQAGSMPARYIRAFERVCGIDFVTRWLAASDNKLLIDIPTGKSGTPQDTHALQVSTTNAVGQVLAFYAGEVSAEEAIAAIQVGLESLAFQRANIRRHAHPELDLGGQA